jgi:hypothetical protein
MSKSLCRPPVARFLLLLFLLLITVPMPSAFSFAMPGVDSSPPSALGKQVNEWVSILSSKEPFAAWRKAAPDIQPLGPGTHSWLVLMSAKSRVVGYLVVQAEADGSFRLGEYGTGAAVLFSNAVLERTLMENGLISSDTNPSLTTVKHYLHPFAAFWEVIIGSETYWIDAKTGELLPMDSKLFHSVNTAKTPLPASAGQGISSLWLKKTFDPYERLPWLTGEKPFASQDAKKVQSRIRSALHLRYVSEPFGDAMLYAVPAIGFQSWVGGRLDVALDMDGTRFIPLDTLNSYGHFYR